MKVSSQRNSPGVISLGTMETLTKGWKKSNGDGECEQIPPQPLQRRADGTRAEPLMDDQDSQGDSEEEEEVTTPSCEVANHIIIEAEKFKANVSAPQGKPDIKNSLGFTKAEMEFKRLFDTDDDFFHVMCHIDESLKAKIVKGEYVDLEHLIPRGRADNFRLTNENHMEWVNVNGHPYLVPVQDKDCKINSIQRWEQAFRIYAAIYTAAHPE